VWHPQVQRPQLAHSLRARTHKHTYSHPNTHILVCAHTHTHTHTTPQENAHTLLHVHAKTWLTWGHSGVSAGDGAPQDCQLILCARIAPYANIDPMENGPPLPPEIQWHQVPRLCRINVQSRRDIDGQNFHGIDAHSSRGACWPLLSHLLAPRAQQPRGQAPVSLYTAAAWPGPRQPVHSSRLARPPSRRQSSNSSGSPCLLPIPLPKAGAAFAWRQLLHLLIVLFSPARFPLSCPCTSIRPSLCPSTHTTNRLQRVHLHGKPCL